jgi:hypothetical protein
LPAGVSVNDTGWNASSGVGSPAPWIIVPRAARCSLVCGGRPAATFVALVGAVVVAFEACFFAATLLDDLAGVRAAASPVDLRGTGVLAVVAFAIWADAMVYHIPESMVRWAY